MWTRRAFLRSGALTAFACGVGGVPGFLTRTAQAASKGIQKDRPTLVALFQRGAMDGLMAVQPLGDSALQKARPGLWLAGDSVLPLDGRFGLHAAGRPLLQAFSEGHLAVVHGVGSPDTTRSHFDAQDYMETGTPGRKGTDSGWLNRALGLTGHDHTPYGAVSWSPSVPRSLSGTNPALAVENLEEFQVRAGGGADNLESLYAEATRGGGKAGQLLSKSGSDAFEATHVLSRENVRSYQPANGARYPTTPLGRSLRQVALLIKSEVGLEVACVEHSGWDTHVAQGTGNGPFARHFGDLCGSIAAFWQDLGPEYQGRVVLQTMTEFGRTVAQNGSGGTDHGRGSCMFVLGSAVRGGKVYGNVGSLATDALEDRRDLPVTTDFRSLFSDVACNHLKLKGKTASLFPGWQGQPLAVM